MRPSFRFPDPDVDAWFPRVNDQLTRIRQATWYTGIGRLKAGVTLEQARADLAAVRCALANSIPTAIATSRVCSSPSRKQWSADIARRSGCSSGRVGAAVDYLHERRGAAAVSRYATSPRDRDPPGAWRVAHDAGAQLLTETAVLALTGSAVGLAVTAIVGARFARLPATSRGWTRSRSTADCSCIPWRAHASSRCCAG